MKIGAYVFTILPCVTYTAYENGAEGVYLLWCWHRINLTNEEFNGLLWIGKLERV